MNNIICVDVVEGLKNINDETADIVLVDPPYNIGKDFGVTHDKMDLKDYISWCKQWMEECKRILKPSGTIYIYGFSEILAHISVNIEMSHRWLIWQYLNKTVPLARFWQRSHEAIICAWKEQRIFNLDAVREPYTEGFINGAAGKIRAGTSGRFTRKGVKTVYKANDNGALPRDVIKVPALAGGAGKVERILYCETCDQIIRHKEKPEHHAHQIIEHPTQKPSKLTEKLLLAAKPEKGLLVVPFVGTGSELLVAKKLGMDYIGFDINPSYVKMATKLTIDNPSQC